MREEGGLSALARVGFVELRAAGEILDQLAEGGFGQLEENLAAFGEAADPDEALLALRALSWRDPAALGAVLADPERTARLILLLGGSSGLAEFLQRAPGELGPVTEPVAALPTVDVLRASLRASVAGLLGEEGRTALRRRYRRELARIAVLDLGHPEPAEIVEPVAAALADLAEAALEASLDLARAQLAADGQATAEELADTELAVMAMGKCGARELNYVSDVDVIFAAEAREGSALETARAVDIATRLARLLMRGIDEPGLEPPLWPVDANLRPEGKDGALVRTVDSHGSYYDRWAHGWEFQALLKARPVAGSRAVGERYLARMQPMVWSSASRENFVESVQKMRGRVTEHIPADEVDIQLKLGPGGLRDVEFTVQLLQLVHGQTDAGVRQRGTIPALDALAEAGYIGRPEAASFAGDYRLLRMLEHRLQLRRLRRTHLMPRDEAGLRALARAARIPGGHEQLTLQWHRVKNSVRGLHERLFYRPLLAAVARLPQEESLLTSEQAEARLAAIGFASPRDALAHIAALTQGVSRRAAIQRTLLPVMLQWFAEGADPDHGLLAFRRLSESLGDSTWYLRMLRDSTAAAERLCTILSQSRFAADLMERFPESAAWLEKDEELRPRSWRSLEEEVLATVDRHADPEAAAAALRTARRREVLRLAVAGILGTVTIEELGVGLSDIGISLLRGVLRVIRRDGGPWPEFAIIAMGRFGGEELGLGSDVDVMYVYRPLAGMTGEVAQKQAETIVSRIKEYTLDPLLPFDIDLGLRPEGKNGAVVRSLVSYRAYYERWSLTWEAQALLRARGIVGDAALNQAFMALADEHRYPSEIGETELREIRRIKARVESERLPQGVDPKRHLKLGRGSLSDVEWLVQYWQLQHGHAHPELRTASTLSALAGAAAVGIVSSADAERLRAAWVLASRVRSALTLWNRSTSDVLPSDRQQLEGIARLLEYPPGSATRMEEDYLRTTRLARQVFEREFYGEG